MIKLVTANLLEVDAEALVNTVNTVGVMGKGIALQFKQAYPDNYEAYRKACSHHEIKPGKMFVFPTGKLVNPMYIINFPTKRHWKGKSRMEDIEVGIKDLVDVVKKLGIHSIAIPPLGCGSGGLKWAEIKPRIEAAFRDLAGVDVFLFKPQGAPEAEDMRVATKRAAMTSGRAAVSRPAELPRQPLAELYVNLSAHTAPIIQPKRLCFTQSVPPNSWLTQ